jgi:hypothetical protein
MSPNRNEETTSGPPSPLSVGRATLGRYRLGRRLGRGARGIVYGGEDPDGRRVALRVLPDGSEEVEQRSHAEWQRCVLDAAMQELARHERHPPGNLGHTVLRLLIDDPDASKQSGQTFNAVALRRQVSRARECPAELGLMRCVERCRGA